MSNWWIKKGHAGRLAVVNYQPFPGEEAVKRSFRYREEAMTEMEGLERKQRLNRAIVQGIGLAFILLAMVTTFGCAHQSEFAEHYDDCMQEHSMKRVQSVAAREQCQYVARQEARR